MITETQVWAEIYRLSELIINNSAWLLVFLGYFWVSRFFKKSF